MNCLLCNLDKGEYLDPGVLGDGRDLRDFAGLLSLTLAALGLLLADVEARDKEHPLWGRWAGQRIVVAPASGKPGHGLPAKWRKAWESRVGKPAPQTPDPCLYDFALACQVDISLAALAALAGTARIVSTAAKVRRDGTLRNPPRVPTELRAYLAGVDPVDDSDPDAAFEV